MTLRTTLTELFSAAFVAEGVAANFGEVVVSQRPELADFQCNGALAAAKVAGRSPRDIAEAVVARIDAPDVVADLSIAGPGFINITVGAGALAESISIMASDERLSTPTVEDPCAYRREQNAIRTPKRED